MSRPGPLKDFPLDRFLPPNPNLSPVSRKRPSSPSTVFSPAKRRILSEEGIYTPKSARRITFSDVLAGPSSPAKRLDFGSPKQTPSGSRLQTSSADIDDCFGPPPSSSSLPSSQTDTQSIHYPGFRVYYDPQIPSSVDNQPAVCNKETDVAVKENVPPRRKTRKAATVPPETVSKSQLLTPTTKRRESERLKKAKSTPATPKKSLTGDRVQLGSPTPRRTIFGQEPASTPRLKGLESMRRLLEKEGDDEQSITA